LLRASISSRQILHLDTLRRKEPIARHQLERVPLVYEGAFSLDIIKGFSDGDFGQDINPTTIISVAIANYLGCRLTGAIGFGR
jgi:hypothetical protein